MEEEKEGRRVWIIPDGDLPPPGEGELKGHESLIIINTNSEAADVKLDFFFEEKEPVEGISVSVPGRRVRCFRLDKPLGKEKHLVPVVVQFGRMDIRQPNLAYYCTMGFPAK